MGVDLREVRERGGVDMIKMHCLQEVNKWNNRKKGGHSPFSLFWATGVFWVAILRAVTARAGTCPFLDLREKQQGRVGPDLWGGPSWSNRYKPGKFHSPKAKREEKVSPRLSYERSGKEGLRSSRVTSGLKTLYMRGGEALYPGGWQRTWKHFQKEDVLNKSSEKSPRLSPNHGSSCIEWKYWRCSGTPHA